MTTIAHPVTGESLPDDLDVLRHADLETEAYLAEQKAAVRPVYAARDILRARVAELAGPAVLPLRARRSDVQARVGRCPRCGDRIEGGDAA